MNIPSQDTSIRVSKVVHSKLVEHIKEDDRKIGKFTELAIIEKIEKEKKDNGNKL